jgi:hypothetical protein
MSSSIVILFCFCKGRIIQTSDVIYVKFIRYYLKISPYLSCNCWLPQNIPHITDRYVDDALPIANKPKAKENVCVDAMLLFCIQLKEK